MFHKSLLFFPAAMLLAAVGCASQQQTFDVTVTNNINEPISVWMTKARTPPGDRYERGWVPPEVLAVGNTQELGGTAIDPGEVAHTVLKGTIAPDDVAVLRVYKAVELNKILSISHDSPDRLDIPLDPGRTDIDIVKKDGGIGYIEHGRAPQ